MYYIEGYLNNKVYLTLMKNKNDDYYKKKYNNSNRVFIKKNKELLK